MQKIVLFGAGGTLQNFLREIKYSIQFQEDEIVAICDNDESKCGKKIDTYTIQKPVSLKSLYYDAIVITSLYTKEIKDILRQKYGIVDKILSLEEYRISATIAHNVQMNKARNNGNFLNRQDIFSKNSMVIYTAIIGDYDELKTPKQVLNDCSYVCFTDKENIKSDVWQIRHVNSGDDPRKTVREYKMFPHKFLSEYKTSIWVDASLELQGNMWEYIKKYQYSSPILLFPHPYRICIYEEAAACIHYNMAEKEVILKQINTYYENEYPVNNGLVCGGCIVRQHQNRDIQVLMEEWWNEVCTYSKRDQLSLPYLMWKNHINYDLCNEFIENNAWIKKSSHKLIKE